MHEIEAQDKIEGEVNFSKAFHKKNSMGEPRNEVEKT